MARCRSTVLACVIASACRPADSSASSGEDSAAGEDSGATETGSGSVGGSSTARPGGDAGPLSLVDPGGWALDDPEVAPMASDRTDPVECDYGWGLEDGVFEVDSGLCNWGAFVQATAEDVYEGDTVEVILLHDTLFSEDDEATAHVGAAIGTTVFWDTTLMIPAPPGFLRPTWTADADYPAGTPLHYHVHNHGYNSYRLVDVIVTR